MRQGMAFRETLREKARERAWQREKCGGNGTKWKELMQACLSHARQGYVLSAAQSCALFGRFARCSAPSRGRCGSKPHGGACHVTSAAFCGGSSASRGVSHKACVKAGTARCFASTGALPLVHACGGRGPAGSSPGQAPAPRAARLAAGPAGAPGSAAGRLREQLLSGCSAACRRGCCGCSTGCRRGCCVCCARCCSIEGAVAATMASSRKHNARRRCAAWLAGCAAGCLGRSTAYPLPGPSSITWAGGSWLSRAASWAGLLMGSLLVKPAGPLLSNCRQYCRRQQPAAAGGRGSGGLHAFRVAVWTLRDAVRRAAEGKLCEPQTLGARQRGRKASKPEGGRRARLHFLTCPGASGEAMGGRAAQWSAACPSDRRTRKNVRRRGLGAA